MMRDYVLLTAARNEERYIEKPLVSVVNQTIRPVRWVVVSDRSTDRTDEIVAAYAAKHPFIKLVRVEKSVERNFASKVFALREGLKELAGMSFACLGILDADISFGPDYYERLLQKFEQIPKLGIAGGVLVDCLEDGTQVDRHSSPWSVPGGIQLFRRECFEAIGGLKPLRLGEEDQLAEVQARMAGFVVRAFPDLTGLHFRLTGTAASSPFKALFTSGVRDYYAGTYFPYQVLKCLRHAAYRPFLIGAMCRFAGFLWSGIARKEREIPPDIIAYLRAEQRTRLLQMLKGKTPG